MDMNTRLGIHKRLEWEFGRLGTQGGARHKRF